MEKKQIIKLREANNKDNKLEVENFKEVKIVGVSRNFNGEGRDYFIAFDGKKFFLFTGTSSMFPSNDSYFSNEVFEHMWDEYI